MTERIGTVELPAAPCDTCMSLCCVSLRIPGDTFKSRKSAGVLCPHLKDGGCSIHKIRADHGYGACERYFCGGAGEFVSDISRQIFPEFDRRNEPAKGTSPYEVWKKKARIVDTIFQASHYTFQRMYWLQEAIKHTDDEVTRGEFEHSILHLQILSSIIGKRIAEAQNADLAQLEVEVERLCDSYIRQSTEEIDKLMMTESYKKMERFTIQP